MHRYDSLRQKLQRLKVPYPTGTAAFLVEKFSKHSSVHFGSSDFYTSIAKRNSKSASFTQWRESLFKNGILCSRSSIREQNFFTPGLWLVRELNKKSYKSDVLAPVRLVEELGESTDSRFQELSSKIDSLEQRQKTTEIALQEVYDSLGLGPIDPPEYSKLSSLSFAKGSVKVKSKDLFGSISNQEFN